MLLACLSSPTHPNVLWHTVKRLTSDKGSSKHPNNGHLSRHQCYGCSVVCLWTKDNLCIKECGCSQNVLYSEVPCALYTDAPSSNPQIPCVYGRKLKLNQATPTYQVCTLMHIGAGSSGARGASAPLYTAVVVIYRNGGPALGLRTLCSMQQFEAIKLIMKILWLLVKLHFTHALFFRRVFFELLPSQMFLY